MSYIKEKMLLENVGGMQRSLSIPFTDITPSPLDDTLDAGSYLDELTMPALKRFYDEYIVGQERAKKAMAQILFSTFMLESGGVSTNLFAGMPGSGKTELIRVTCADFPKVTHVWDMSMVSGEGWKGTNISDLMKAIPNDGRKHIVFMDEFCKITNHRNSDVAYHLNVQGNLLRLFEHDASMYKGACSPENITFVAMGEFENIYAKKKKKRNLSASQSLLMKSQMNI